MKLVVVWITCANICVSGGAIFAVVAAQGANKNAQFQASMARIAVREQLDKVLSLSSDSKVRLQRGCAEQNDNGGIVVGTGDALNASRVIDGVRVNEESQFSYRASVLADCDAYNLNCYKVGKIDLNGSRSIVPRL